jgi:hypothetical protein
MPTIDPAHVVGIRSHLDKEGKITPLLAGCGTQPEGNQTLITYRQGKRCWVNKIIFGITDPQEMMNHSSPTIFAAGDSNTDVFFVKDARYHLAINRNKDELMCLALENKGAHWIINPMFIDPLPTRTAEYQCEKFKIKNQKELAF